MSEEISTGQTGFVRSVRKRMLHPFCLSCRFHCVRHTVYLPNAKQQSSPSLALAWHFRLDSRPSSIAPARENSSSKRRPNVFKVVAGESTPNVSVPDENYKLQGLRCTALEIEMNAQQIKTALFRATKNYFLNYKFAFLQSISEFDRLFV